MRPLLLLMLLFAASCKAPKPFNTGLFLDLSSYYHMISDSEKAVVHIYLQELPERNIRSTAAICRKVNFQSVVRQLQLDPVNPDSSFSYLGFLREELSQRSRSGVPVVLRDNAAEKKNEEGFVRELYKNGFLSPAQYAKLLDQLRQEPVVFPFVVYEWLQTMP